MKQSPAALLAATALLALPVLAATATDAAGTVAQLKQQADAWDRAIIAKNRAAIEANMASDFRDIDGHGNVADKAQFLEGITDAQLTIDPYTVPDLDVRLYGDVALLSGTTRMSGSYQGKPFKSNYRYIDIYVHRAGVWRVVSVQISKMPD
jgi:ketosteroid isomerase-like protein